MTAPKSVQEWLDQELAKRPLWQKVLRRIVKTPTLPTAIHDRMPSWFLRLWYWFAPPDWQRRRWQ